MFNMILKEKNSLFLPLLLSFLITIFLYDVNKTCYNIKYNRALKQNLIKSVF